MEQLEQEKKFDIGLFFITLFFGWLGMDKFYYAKAWSKVWQHALIKFLSVFIVIGVFWNLWDLIQIIRKKYKFDFRDYFL